MCPFLEREKAKDQAFCMEKGRKHIKVSFVLFFYSQNSTNEFSEVGWQSNGTKREVMRLLSSIKNVNSGMQS